MHHYILTRFSIADYSCKGFVQTRALSEAEYLAQVFAPSRLDGKFQAFEIMTVPSVLAQTRTNYTWLIYTSAKLPTPYMERLQALSAKHSQIQIRYVESFQQMNEDVDREIVGKAITTLRLDDDDGLAPTFLEHLEPYTYRPNLIVSFPQGKRFTIQAGKVTFTETFRYPLLAIGLAAVGRNIYTCGSHCDLNKTYPVVYDERPDMWCCCASEFQDTKTKV
jgi:hypothetical protein